VTRAFSLISALLLSAGSLLAADPRLSIVLPRGVQRGAEHVLTFSGQRLADAEEILFYQPGFEVLEITSDNPNRCKVKVKVAADTRLGEHVVQVRCKSGVSDYHTVWVGALPALAEKEPNTDFAAPQPIEFGVTVEGIVATEDVDYFAVQAKKGQRIVAEIEALRLGTYLFDPAVSILDMKRFELDAVDDSTLLYQDAVAQIVAPEDGTYLIAVRESSYGGNGNCRYRLHVGNFPRPTAVYPAGGPLGEEVAVRYIGIPTGDVDAKVKLPAEPAENFALFAEDATGIAPSGNVFRLSTVPNALEVEPNDDRGAASPAAFPAAFNGIIGQADDEDWFKFTAKKGQTFEVQCYARRIRSPLDPVIYLYDAAGKAVGSNDDTRGPDSYFRWKVAADGEYTLRVRDHLGNGGPNYVYRVEFQPLEPSLTVSIPRTSRYGQERQQIYVARGNRFATLVSASRQNVAGPVTLDGDNLPAGVTMHAEAMPDYQSTMPVVFEAAADAPIAGRLVDFTAQVGTDPNQMVRGGFTNNALLIRGNPGNSEYWNAVVDRLPIAVVEELPYTLELVEPQVPIVQNGSMQLKVVAHRKEGFTKPINVQFPFRPPGIGATSSVNIPEGKNEVLVPISANDKAREGEYKVYAIGSADVGNGAGWASTPLTTLRIAAPYLQLTLERTACEQGQEVEVFCKVAPGTEFPGDAVAQLVGLPTKATTENVSFNKETKEFSFKVKTDPATPEGRHKNLFCYVTVTENGEPIQHRLGAGELRVDKPLPKATPKPADPKPAAVAAKPEAKPATEKRLTRLEQLRLDAKKRLEAAGGGGGEE
jgi:hypothetical protein